jgi:hypothetical protein
MGTFRTRVDGMGWIGVVDAISIHMHSFILRHLLAIYAPIHAFCAPI